MLKMLKYICPSQMLTVLEELAGKYTFSCAYFLVVPTFSCAYFLAVPTF